MKIKKTVGPGSKPSRIPELRVLSAIVPLHLTAARRPGSATRRRARRTPADPAPPLPSPRPLLAPSPPGARAAAAAASLCRRRRGIVRR